MTTNAVKKTVTKKAATKTVEPPPMLLMRDRMKMLKDRLARVKVPPFVEIDPPYSVDVARRVVEKWEEKMLRLRAKRRDAHYHEVRQIENAVFVGDMKTAVALLTKLEAKVFAAAKKK